MAATAVHSARARRLGVPVLVGLIVGPGLLAASLAALYFSTRNDDLTAYRAAPPCASFEDAVAGKDCRYTMTATVSEVVADNTVDSIYFDVPRHYSPFFVARVAAGDVPVGAGDQAQVEVWRLKVTKIDGIATHDNPATDPRVTNLRIIGLLLLPLAVAAIGGSVVAARRPTATAGSPTMSPVAMSDVLWR